MKIYLFFLSDIISWEWSLLMVTMVVRRTITVIWVVAYLVLSYMYYYITHTPIMIKWVSLGVMEGTLKPTYLWKWRDRIVLVRSDVGNCLFCMSIETTLLGTLVTIRIPKVPSVHDVLESAHSLSGYSELNLVQEFCGLFCPLFETSNPELSSKFKVNYNSII